MQNAAGKSTPSRVCDIIRALASSRGVHALEKRDKQDTIEMFTGPKKRREIPYELPERYGLAGLGLQVGAPVGGAGRGVEGVIVCPQQYGIDTNDHNSVHECSPSACNTGGAYLIVSDRVHQPADRLVLCVCFFWGGNAHRQQAK